MRKYLVRRLFAMVPTLFLMSLIVFFLLRILPGDVAQLILGDVEGGIQANQMSVETLRHELGLDKPLHIQYLTWLSDVLRGDLGNSLLSGKSVTGEMLHRLPITIQLGLMAQITAFL
ncbi:MAG: ABC transporter permease, partial [Dehalococcoidia bacterium]|nr:ABC transporter permease [Dehalococcoidia bacterium]